MKLELGSGYNPTAGYVHLDVNPDAPDVDIVGPAYPLPDAVQDGSCSEIIAVDVLEHLSYWDTDAALADWSRALKPHGLLFVQVPDAERIMCRYVTALTNKDALAKFTKGIPKGLDCSTPLDAAQWRLLGGHHDDKYAKDGDDWRWNAHYAMFSEQSLTDALNRAGFTVITMEINPHPNLRAWAVKR